MTNDSAPQLRWHRPVVVVLWIGCYLQDELGATVHNAVHASGETCTDEARVA